MASQRTTARTPAPAGRKLAETLGHKIEEDIVALGWPVGEVLGSESELLERYGVSRAVLREAIRIVEHHLVAAMRRGPGGGLVVTAPDLTAVIRAVTLQLKFQNIRQQDLHETRAGIEMICLRLAAERLTNEGIVRLQQHFSREGSSSDDFHVLIAELTGNPAMVLFQRVLGTLAREYMAGTQNVSKLAGLVHQAHKRIADALIARDIELAERLLVRHLEVVGKITLPGTPPPRPRRSKSRK